VFFLFFKKIHAILGREGLALGMLKVKIPKKKRLLLKTHFFNQRLKPGFQKAEPAI